MSTDGKALKFRAAKLKGFTVVSTTYEAVFRAYLNIINAFQACELAKV